MQIYYQSAKSPTIGSDQLVISQTLLSYHYGLPFGRGTHQCWGSEMLAVCTLHQLICSVYWPSHHSAKNLLLPLEAKLLFHNHRYWQKTGTVLPYACPLETVLSSLPWSQLHFVLLSINPKHHLQYLTHHLLKLLNILYLSLSYVSVLATYVIFDLWSRPWGMANCWVFVNFLRPHPSKGVKIVKAISHQKIFKLRIFVYKVSC